MSRPTRLPHILPKPDDFRSPLGPPDDPSKRKRQRADLACQSTSLVVLYFTKTDILNQIVGRGK